MNLGLTVFFHYDRDFTLWKKTNRTNRKAEAGHGMLNVCAAAMCGYPESITRPCARHVKAGCGTSQKRRLKNDRNKIQDSRKNKAVRPDFGRQYRNAQRRSEVSCRAGKNK